MLIARSFAAGAPQRKSGRLDALDDPEIALAGVVEHLQGRLIAGAVMAGLGRLHAVELDHDDAFLQPRFIGDGGIAAGEETAAGGLDRGARQFRLRRDFLRVLVRPIARYPIRLGHVPLRHVDVVARTLARRTAAGKAG